MFVASELHERHNVTCYTRREEQKHLLLKEGLIYNQRKISVHAKTIDELSSHDVYIVCVKQTELDSVLPYLHNVFKERSEERRVGKECRAQCAAKDSPNKNNVW